MWPVTSAPALPSVSPQSTGCPLLPCCPYLLLPPPLTSCDLSWAALVWHAGTRAVVAWGVGSHVPTAYDLSSEMLPTLQTV